MKKLVAVGFLALVGFSLAGCAEQPGRIDGDTSGFAREVVTLGGQQFDCIFKDKGFNNGTMSCEPLATQDGLGKSDTPGYSREVITIGGEKFDCLFKDRGFNNGTMSCEPVAK